MNPPETLSWRKRHRFGIHLTALLVTILAPLLLYSALQSEAEVLSAVLFGLIAAAYAVVIWAG